MQNTAELIQYAIRTGMGSRSDRRVRTSASRSFASRSPAPAHCDVYSGDALPVPHLPTVPAAPLWLSRLVRERVLPVRERAGCREP